MKTDYSFLVTARKMLVSVVLFGVPVLLQVMPNDVLNLTVGALLVGLVNFVKYNK
jgi:hypothetical protein